MHKLWFAVNFILFVFTCLMFGYLVPELDYNIICLLYIIADICISTLISVINITAATINNYGSTASEKIISDKSFIVLLILSVTLGLANVYIMITTQYTNLLYLDYWLILARLLILAIMHFD